MELFVLWPCGIYLFVEVEVEYSSTVVGAESIRGFGLRDGGDGVIL